MYKTKGGFLGSNNSSTLIVVSWVVFTITVEE
jgi:hypothetical protein